MPAQDPLKPLEALNQFAPHNVLASLLSGGDITITPAMARQPTLYEVRYGYRPLDSRPEPVSPQVSASSPGLLPDMLPAMHPAKVAGPFILGDEMLRLAPHNILATLLSGGQVPLTPGEQKALDMGQWTDLPFGVTLRTFKSKERRVQWMDPNTGAMNFNVAFLQWKGSYVTIKNTDRDFITLVVTELERPSGGEVAAKVVFVPLSESVSPKGEAAWVPVPKTSPKIVTLRKGQSKTWTETTGTKTKTIKRGSYAWGLVTTETKVKFDRAIKIELVPPVGLSTTERGALESKKLKWEQDLAAQKAAAAAAEAAKEALAKLRADALDDIELYAWDADDEIEYMNGVLTNATTDVSEIEGIAGTVGGLGTPAQTTAINSNLLTAQTKLTRMESLITSSNTRRETILGYGDSIINASTETSINYYRDMAKDEYNGVLDERDEVKTLAGDIYDLRGNSHINLSSAQSEWEKGVAAEAARLEEELKEAKKRSREEIRKLRDRADALMDKARALERQGKYLEAAAKYEEAASLYEKGGYTILAGRARSKAGEMPGRKTSAEEAQRKVEEWQRQREEEARRRKEEAERRKRERQEQAESISREAWEWRRKIAEQKRRK